MSGHGFRTRRRPAATPPRARSGRFEVQTQAGISSWSRTYKDTPAGRLAAARDRVADEARLDGHDLTFWSKTRTAEPCYTASCSKCGCGVKIVAGRAAMNLPGFPSLLSRGRVGWCPGPRRQR